MSGHSKWSTIKRKKGKADAERGKIFTRLTKEIAVAAREGGGDPETNSRLRTAIVSAKTQNMPSDNIKRAIQKGTGDLPGAVFESHIYEGYGPGGVALYLEIMTDNKNRSVAEIRHALAKYGGNLGSNGCVAWMFDKKGVITVDFESSTEDALMDIALDAGAAVMNTPRITFPAAAMKATEQEDSLPMARLIARLNLIQIEAMQYARGSKRHDLFAAMEEAKQSDVGT